MAALGSQCCYLDGTNGVCQSGYSLGDSSLITATSTWWAGLYPYTTQSANCCFKTAEGLVPYYQGEGCNSASDGNFWTAVVPIHDTGCLTVTSTTQLTLCWCGRDRQPDPAALSTATSSARALTLTASAPARAVLSEPVRRHHPRPLRRPSQSKLLRSRRASLTPAG